ncbi:SH3 domain-containing protein [Streptomyces sp. DT24]|uniref:SH3 domain-containing protein n=1 Tax=unclassified Streptomyces TaxID=2593676 RepID=UPI0023B91B73|nr:SH3 domain-containing protein [Streptomyces sp. AM 4-1-1]WEH35544.1 SH3 domain-containing protein [Streptomyces sp. AM 4-1-1]
MNRSRIQRQVATTLAALVIAGAGALAATPAVASTAPDTMSGTRTAPLPQPVQPAPLHQLPLHQAPHPAAVHQAPHLAPLHQAPQTAPRPQSPQAPQADPSAAYAKGKVISKIPLNVHSRPTTSSPVIGTIPPGTIITLVCKVRSERVDGNDIWYKLGGSRTGWVTARYVENLSPVPYC